MRAVFLDKDNTLLRDVPYNVDPRRMTLAPGATEAVAELTRAGFALAVVSNQAGVARGVIREDELGPVARRLRELVGDAGGELLDVLFCPHDPDGAVPAYSMECRCRKPRPGMLLEAARRHGLALEDSWMIGDILDDVEAGRRAGCRSVLLLNGGETEWRTGPMRGPDLVAADLAAAAGLVVAEAARRADVG